MVMSRVRKRLLLAIGLATALTAAAPASANAETVREQKSESHCVVYVVDKTDKGELKMSAPTCAQSIEGAAEIASRSIFLPQSAALDGLAFSHSTFTLGTHFDGSNGTGSSITVVGTSCTGGYWNTPGWFDNKTSSSFNGCARLRHYDKPNKKGAIASTIGAGTTDNIPGFMNNRTESVAYFSS